MTSHDLEPDDKLTPDQTNLVAQLTEVEAQAIDDALLSNTDKNWRKVAMVVGATMAALPRSVAGIPDAYFSARVRKLVDDGLLESQGNLSHMRYSEVRRPSGNETEQVSSA